MIESIFLLEKEGIREILTSMKIVQKLDYAVRVMVQLAIRYDHTTLTQLDELAESEHVSIPFLAQILNELRKAGLVESRRGKNGGYILKSSPDAITLHDVIVVIEGNILEHHPQPGESSTAVSGAWTKLNDVLEKETKATTLASLATDAKTPMFFI